MFKIERDLDSIETYLLRFIIFSISLLNISKYILPPLIIQLSCCSPTKSCLTLCDPMDGSTPGFLSFTISPSLFKVMSTESVMPVNHLILCCPLLFLTSIFPTSGSFPMSQLLTIYVYSDLNSSISSISPVSSFPLKGPCRCFFNSNWDHLCPSILFVQRSFFSQACCLRKYFLLSFDQQICSLF